MDISREEIDDYLKEIRSSIRAGRYRIDQNSNRQDNIKLFVNYMINSEDAERILLSLETEDFSMKAQNRHPGYEYEILYIFGKDVLLLERFGTEEKTVPLYIKFNKLTNQFVIVVSFHEQKRPLSYPFKELQSDKTNSIGAGKAKKSDTSAEKINVHKRQ